MVHRFLQFILPFFFKKYLKGSVISLCPGVVITTKAWDEDIKEEVRVSLCIAVSILGR